MLRKQNKIFYKTPGLLSSDLNYLRQIFSVSSSGLFLVLIAGLSLSIQTAAAEDFSYCGLKLSIDTIKQVDAENVKVVIGADERIIARTNLGHWAAEKVLLNPASLSKVSTGELSDFVSQCSGSETLSVTSSAVSEIFKRGEVNSFSARKFLEEDAGNQEVIEAVLGDLAWEARVRQSLSAGQIRLVSESLAEIVVLNPQWVRSRAIRLFYLLSEPVYAVMLDRVKEDLASDSLVYLASLNSALEVLGDELSKNAIFLKQATALALKLFQEQFDTETIRLVLSKAKDSDALLDLLYPKISSRLIGAAGQALDAQKLEEALALTNLLLPSRSSPDALALVAKILARLKLDSALNLEENTCQLFAAYSKVDSSVATDYMAFLEVQFLRQLDAGKASDSEIVLSHILMQRPDPALGNDRLRYRQALAYARQGSQQSASEKLSQIQTGVSIWQYLRFLIAGAAFSSLFLSFFALLSLAVLCGLILRRGILKSLYLKTLDTILKLKKAKSEKIENKRRSKSSAEESASDDEDTDERASSFVKHDTMRAMNPFNIQYRKGLAKFGLNEDVSLAEIKTAYRTIVKEYHPDRNPNQSKEDAHKFLELSKLYEELLELRQQLGMVD